MNNERTQRKHTQVLDLAAPQDSEAIEIVVLNCAIEIYLCRELIVATATGLPINNSANNASI